MSLDIYFTNRFNKKFFNKIQKHIIKGNIFRLKC